MDPVEGFTALGAGRGAVVAKAPPDLCRGVVSTQDVHPGLSGGAAAGADHRAAAAAGGEGEIASGNRAVSEVAGEYGVSWPTAHKALVVAAAKWLPEPPPTPRLGIDETRFGSVRWILDGITWKRSDPWLTSFVDCSRDGPGSLLGLAPGRTGACVREWLAEQSQEFRDAIKIVVIDPSAPYASGIRAALPDAKIAVDKWHLVALANQMVTEGSATRHPRPARPARHGRRPGLGEPAAAAHRRRTPLAEAMGPAHPDAR
jgi:hypothetical protein